MTCIDIDLQTPRAEALGRRSYLASIADFARATWRRYWMRRAQRATVLILQSLDDRTLRDIGISASEITSCVYGEVPGRRRRYGFGPQVGLRLPAAGAVSRHDS